MGGDAEMPKWVDCPYYMYDKDNYIKCEGSKKEFKDREELKKHLDKVCGNIGTYGQCEIAAAINKKWEDTF
jgi:hypothetical protein